MEIVIKILTDEDQAYKVGKAYMLDVIKDGVCGIMSQFKDGNYTASPGIDYEVSVEINDEQDRKDN